MEIEWRTALEAHFQSEMTADQLSCIDAIQQTFVRMGRESWTDGAVSNSSEWKQIRQLSSIALEAFSWSHQKNVGRSVKEDELSNLGQTLVPR
jgi:hypothetical protein